MRLKLVGKRHETSNIWSFDFEPMDKLSWQAGQSIRLEIPKKTWGYSERRFTISSLPSAPNLKIITRISNSEFKQDLGQLKIGSKISGYNIEGKLDWGDLSRTKIFIAGGTGITLFHMAIRQALLEKIPVNLLILYSSRDTPMLFEDYFDHISKTNSYIDIIKSSKRFDVNYIFNKLQTYEVYDLHIAGPNDMVFGLKSGLKKLGISDQVLKSNFLQ